MAPKSLRLNLEHSHAGMHRRLQLYFGRDCKAYKKAKTAWAEYAQAWQGKAVSADEWATALACMRRYLPESRSHSDRAKIRWDTVVSAESQRTDPAAPVSGKVHLVTVCRHKGLDLNIQNGIGDITLCHMGCRRSAKVGGLVVAISAVATAGPPKADGIGSRWPPEFNDAITRVSLL